MTWPFENDTSADVYKRQSLGIFMAYTYMKTQNIWVPIIIHFLNNNMVVVFSGTYSADVLQNQQIHWGAIPVALVMNCLLYTSLPFASFCVLLW